MIIAVIVGVIIIITTVHNNNPEPSVPPPAEEIVTEVQTPNRPPEKFYFYENLARYCYDDFKFSNDGNFITYTEENYKGIAGIDVSNHNGEIDWQTVAESGVEFAMISVGYRGYTEGGLNEDENFHKNVAGALEAGLDVGVYLFSQATSVTEAVEEAQFVLERIEEEYDLKAYEKAIAAFQEDPVTFTLDEVERELGLL